ncbi:hypothetical protein Mapa_004863 [Marchantia paleacea]|nr:hypothetical protein Mapa_004863 [Marchantia paleacea]
MHSTSIAVTGREIYLPTFGGCQLENLESVSLEISEYTSFADTGRICVCDESGTSITWTRLSVGVFNLRW